MSSVEVIMPQMGESITEGTVVRWLKAVGDAVERDENILEISTDKVDAEIPSPASGVLSSILIQAGATVAVGTALALINTAAQAATAPAPLVAAAAPATLMLAVGPAAPAPVHAGAAPVDVIMPQMGESITEGTVVRWLKAVGDTVERDENILEISTDKVDAEIPSPASGVLSSILVKAGATVAVGTALAQVAPPGGAAFGATAHAAPTHAVAAPAAPTHAVAAPAAPAPAAAMSVATGRGYQAVLKPGVDADVAALRRQRSTPLVRKIAAAHRIDITALRGSGESGRVTRKDIEAYIAAGGAVAAAPAPVSYAAPAARVAAPVGVMPAAPISAAVVESPVIAMLEGDRVEDMSPMRVRIAEHMVMSRRVSAHAHTVHEVDFAAALKARAAWKGKYAARGVNLTITAFIAKACVQALLKYPVLNSVVSGKQVVYRGRINLGVAVALEDGLIVPVIKGADTMNLMGLSQAINDLAERARTKKLKPDEVKGGTFTLTNPGAFGSLFGVPIINQPQVGILGCGAVKKRVVADDQDRISIQPQAVFCLSFDHRVVDGAVADHFMVAVRESLLNPTE
jgi:pyruvate dehydrogenase E2 component (dihydrolipoamide acetyltransferase)